MPGTSKPCWRSAMIPLPQLTGAALENRNVAETAFDTPLAFKRTKVHFPDAKRRTANEKT
jgi:hypothetical protein